MLGKILQEWRVGCKTQKRSIGVANFFILAVVLIHWLPSRFYLHTVQRFSISERSVENLYPNVEKGTVSEMVANRLRFPLYDFLAPHYLPGITCALNSIAFGFLLYSFLVLFFFSLKKTKPFGIFSKQVWWVALLVWILVAQAVLLTRGLAPHFFL
jgi:hypothetical protein